MKLKIIIMLALLYLPARSAVITLDFESPLPGGLVAATHSHLATAPLSSIISTQYSNYGVVFGGTVLLNLGSPHQPSGVNGLGGLDLQGRFDSGAPLTLTFVSPLDGQTAATTDFFSIVPDLFNGSDNSVLISAYGLGGNLLGTATYQEPGQTFGSSAPITLSGIGLIHSIVVDATLNDYTTGGGGIQFDLVSFEAPSVPEPSITVLACSGLLMLVTRRRRALAPVLA